MARCKGCANCVAVVSFKDLTRGKRNVKKVKRFETANPCTNKIVSTRKRSVNELEQLGAVAVQGGQFRRGSVQEKQLVNVKLGATTPTDPHSRASRPICSLKEPTAFDQESFDKFLQLVKQCEDAASAATNHEVAMESTSMIKKMRRLLHPTMRDQVDYEEATKDCSNIFLWWIDNQPAGSNAFIPTYEDREICAAALQIYACAAEEARCIPIEYYTEFGDEGIHLYNELIGIIGEQDKKCLPFVNMCLRVWMNKVADDVDLWADLQVLDFEKWIMKEIEKPLEEYSSGRTSYQLMMSIFGNEQVSNSTTPLLWCE